MKFTLTDEQVAGLVFRLSYADGSFPGHPIGIEHPDGTIDQHIVLGEICKPVLINFSPRRCRVEGWSRTGLPFFWVSTAPMQSGDSFSFSGPITVEIS